MRISMKVILWLWVGLFVILGGLFYGAYSKLNPESFIALLNEQVQKNYPGARLNVGSVDYDFALDFSLDLKNLTLTRGTELLGKANEIELKIPWWVILLNRGSAQINLSGLDIYVTNEAIIQTETSSKEQSPLSDKVEFDLPAYMVGTQYTLRAKDVSVRELNTDRRFFSLSKLLVREFQYGKNSAFELNIPISINHKGKNYASELWLFGDVTPEFSKWKMNYRGEFKTKDAEGFHFEDLVIGGKASFNPLSMDFNSEIELMIEKKSVGKGKVIAQHDKLDLNLKFNQFPLSYLTVVGDEIRNPFWVESEGKAEGELKLQRDFKTDGKTHLSGKLHFPGKFTLDSEVGVVGKWHISFDDEKWETSFLTSKGDVSFFRRAVVDFKQGMVKQYNQEMGFDGVDLNFALLAAKPLSHFLIDNTETYHVTVISIKNCTQGEKVVDGSFRYGIAPLQKFYQANLEIEENGLEVNYQQKSGGQQLSMAFNKFSWSPSYKFMEPFFNASSGEINGKIDGQWKVHWSDGKWLFKLKGNDLKNLQGEFAELNQATWNIYNIDSQIHHNKSWNGNVNNGIIKFNSLTLESSDPIVLSGTLTASPKQKSYLTLTYPKNKKWKPVKKEIQEVFWKKDSL